MMSSCSPRNVIVAQVERVPFAAYCEQLPIGREYRFMALLTDPSRFPHVWGAISLGGVDGAPSADVGTRRNSEQAEDLALKWIEAGLEYLDDLVVAHELVSGDSGKDLEHT